MDMVYNLEQVILQGEILIHILGKTTVNMYLLFIPYNKQIFIKKLEKILKNVLMRIRQN